MDRVFERQILSTEQKSANQEFIALSDIVGFLRRYVRTIATCLAAALLVAWFYNSTTDPVFTASTQILIEPRIPQHLQQGAGEVNLSLDTAQVESQIAVLRSEKIASMVIERLGLDEDPKFNRPHTRTIGERFGHMKDLLADALGVRDSAWLSGIEGYFAGEAEKPEAPSDYQRTRQAMLLFLRGLEVRRLGVSYAIDISFNSLDPDAAADIANATAEAFVREQIETKAEAAKQGGRWLETRLGELRTQMNKAMEEAQIFRARHDYRVDPGEEGDAEDAPTLEELEVTAETYRKMYESFLHAYTNSVSQQSYPVADARVITAAMAPLSPSAPRPKLMLAFAAVAGTIIGIGVALIRHTFDTTIRSPRHIRDSLGLECVGELPPAARLNRAGRGDEVARKPHSAYSHSLRKARTEISLAETSRPVRYLGLTSTSSGGSKTVIASNLATLYAMSGLRTLVVDATLQNPTNPRRLTPPPGDEAIPIQHSASLNGITVPGRAFDVLPASVVDEKNLLSPRAMQLFLSELVAYDMVIVDLPAMTSAPDQLSVGSALDGVVIVAEWGKTHVDTVVELARSLQASRTLMIGVLLANSRGMTTRRPKT